MIKSITHHQKQTATISLTKLSNTIKRIISNRELIGYFEAYLKTLTAAEKIRTLHLLKKLTIQIVRQPDPEHYKAYQDEYEELFDSIQEEQERHNPVKWLEAELEYFNNINKKLTVEEVTNELNVMQAAKERLSKAWLTKDEMMQLFDISKSTLNRRIAEGMPAHKKGKAVHFYLQEVNEWMKDEKAA